LIDKRAEQSPDPDQMLSQWADTLAIRLERLADALERDAATP
jgi:hypothetical protein